MEKVSQTYSFDGEVWVTRDVRNTTKKSNKDRYAVRLGRIKYEAKNKAYIGKDLGLRIKNKIITTI